jgi:hypothetical protein
VHLGEETTVVIQATLPTGTVDIPARNRFTTARRQPATRSPHPELDGATTCAGSRRR